MKRYRKQWINLENVTQACIVQPEICTSGATIALWIKLTDWCNAHGSVISTFGQETSVGFEIGCNRVQFGQNYFKWRYVIR